MQVNFIRCDICLKNDVKRYDTYYIEKDIGERVNERYDICEECLERINKLIEEIQDENDTLPF